jgi:hypothetical protein
VTPGAVELEIRRGGLLTCVCTTDDEADISKERKVPDGHPEQGMTSSPASRHGTA